MSINQDLLAKTLLAKKLISEKSLKSLLEHASAQNISLEDLLFEREVVPDEKLGEVIAELYKASFLKLSEKTIGEPLLHLIPYTLAAHQYVIPFEQTGNTLKVAINNPHNYELLSFIEKKTGFCIEAYYATKKEIKASLKAYNRDVNEKFNKLLKSALKDPNQIESLKDAAKILDTIILFAYQNNSSDIHIEPHKDFITIRYRIDGLLQTIAELPIAILDLLTTRIKVLANLRTDEHKAAQDGRFKIDLESNEITMRVSIMPTYDGEKTVLRLLSSTNQELDLETLGYSSHALKTVHNSILKTHGMILMTGPTGSGKTTTLYSILKLLNSPEVNISTIEDPIEYRMEGINQIQVNPKTNLTFANGLRSLLRQDPDIVMVGEIRDEETAGIAINAALTGHLVLATLHTNDAASTIPRLHEIGIESFLVGDTVKLVIAQRLVRTICQKCKKSYEIDYEQLKVLQEKNELKRDFVSLFREIQGQYPELQKKNDNPENNKFTFYRGEGCSACSNSGFKGRTAISEMFEVSDAIRKAILNNATPQEIEEVAVKEGMTTLFADGMIKVLQGVTTIEEVLRVMRS